MCVYRYINVAAYFGRGGGGLAFLPPGRGGGAVKLQRDFFFKEQSQQNKKNIQSFDFYFCFTYVFPSLYRQVVWVEAAFLFSHLQVWVGAAAFLCRRWVWLVEAGVLSWLHQDEEAVL